ncbi:MAG: GH36-type glycosyl hydrolase domain-containing protein [Candidatus Odinarchaeota archaeon]
MTKSTGNGSFGHWFIDGHGLPAYEYTCNQEQDTRASVFTTQGLSNLHWHQIGNLALNAIVTNYGYVQVLSSSRGLQWLNRYDKKKKSLGGGIAVIHEGDKTWSDLFSAQLSKISYKRVFGTGYFQKITKHSSLSLDHKIVSPLQDDPVLMTEITITNESDRIRDMTVFEHFSVNLHYILGSLIYVTRKRKHFATKGILKVLGHLYKWLVLLIGAGTEQKRTRFGRNFRFTQFYDGEWNCLIITPKYRKKVKTTLNERNSRNYFPDSLFLASLNEPPSEVISSSSSLVTKNGQFLITPAPRQMIGPVKNPCLSLGIDISLKPGETRSLVFLFGYSSRPSITNLVKKYRTRFQDGNDFFSENSREWKNLLVDFASFGNGWLVREAKWHSYYVLSAILRDDYFQNSFLPQGGPYDYLHGLRGAPRDYALYAVTLVYLAPHLAREIIEVILRMMSREGKLFYAGHGFGMVTGAFVHQHPSDVHLFLLWALTEYLCFTRDFDFLKKEVPFYPKKENSSSTVQERVFLAIDYILNVIGLGEHDLIRSGDGDWSDGISLFVKNRRAFTKRGESAFNSAMALYVFPRVIALFRSTNNPTIKELQVVFERLISGINQSWTGEWFCRGWDGTNKPIGDDRIFLEHHAWLLISRALPENQVKKLINSIYRILDEPSEFGQYLLYPPASSISYLEKGWDVNGGIWFAINFLLTWGYSLYDQEKAFKSLFKNSMANHADLYPDIWYGIWSGPDAINAGYSKRPGETYYQLPTPSTDWPIMNANLHANFLMALIKLCGIEPVPEGIYLSPKIPKKEFSLKTAAFELKVTENEIQFNYYLEVRDHFMLKLQKPDSWDGPVNVTVNGIQIATDKNTDTKSITVEITEKNSPLHAVFKPAGFI